MKIRVLLADDHKMVREALHRLLETDPEIEVVAEVGDGGEVLRRVKETHPAVVCMDVGLPGLNGIDATRRLCTVCPEVKVIGVSAHLDEKFMFEMLDAGAAGYVAKSDDGSALLQAIHAVIRNQIYLCPEVSGGLVDRLRGQAPPCRAATCGLAHLTRTGSIATAGRRQFDAAHRRAPLPLPRHRGRAPAQHPAQTRLPHRRGPEPLRDPGRAERGLGRQAHAGGGTLAAILEVTAAYLNALVQRIHPIHAGMQRGPHITHGWLRTRYRKRPPSLHVPPDAIHCACFRKIKKLMTFFIVVSPLVGTVAVGNNGRMHGSLRPSSYR